MNIVTGETKAKSLQSIREKISKTSDSKKKFELAQEARQLRGETPKR
jgi:hypothetical protein